MYQNPYLAGDSNVQNQLASMLLGQNTQSQQQAQRHITKVNGRAGADAYNMPPNSDDILLDMNSPIIYLVQTDGAGYKTITPYDISLHKEVKPEDQYKSLEERISKLEEAIANGKSNYRPNEQRSKQFQSGDKHTDAGVRSDVKG